MSKRLWSSALLIVLAKSTLAQVVLAPTTPAASLRLAPLAARPSYAANPIAAVSRVHTDTSHASRKRQLIGATIGAALGGLVGGTYAFQEGTSGCKGIPCDQPQHLWAYPVGGAAIDAIIGVWIARF